MLTSRATTEIITFFVRHIRDASLSIWPSIIMTDHDQAQIAALETVYPHSQIFLCRWYMPRMIRSHFMTSQFQKLWEKIKCWVITDDLVMFFNIWDKISSNPSTPQSIVKYLQTEWLPVLHMWSGTERKNWTIFEEENTNMLIKSYVFYFLPRKFTDQILDTTINWSPIVLAGSATSTSIMSLRSLWLISFQTTKTGISNNLSG